MKKVVAFAGKYRGINMIVNSKKTAVSRVGISVGTAVAVLSLAHLPSGTASEPTRSSSAAQPPRIVSTDPKVGETDVDPSLKEIRITFDKDMGTGFSWTGGPPDFPPTPDGQQAKWSDKRTCVLPVKLEAARYYRVGINSTSFHNFRSADGVPANPSALYFTTRGASETLKRKVSKPAIVELTPKNGANDVDPALKEIRVTFTVPMGEGFSWTGGGEHFPSIPDGKKPLWSDDHKTCVLPVELKPGWEYHLGLNSPSHKNFQSSGGIPLESVSYTFKTKQ
jgi:RNA polymerase sigma-70 factor (ECF subfamily)